MIQVARPIGDSMKVSESRVTMWSCRIRHPWRLYWEDCMRGHGRILAWVDIIQLLGNNENKDAAAAISLWAVTWHNFFVMNTKKGLHLTIQMSAELT